MPMNSELKMHFINGFYETQPNGLTLPICSDNTGRFRFRVTSDPGKITCKNCLKLFGAANQDCETGIINSRMQRWFVRWGHRIRIQ